MSNPQIPEGFRLYEAPDRFPGKIGPLYFKRDGEDYQFGFLVERGHTNANRILHGGMMMSFADEMMGHHVFRATGKKMCATISLNFDFVASAKEGDWVDLKCKITRKGVSVVFIRGELYVGGEIILTADGIWKIFNRPSETKGRGE
jgi:acyl-coenzyme A thioesterase PaaI-like protein